MPTKAKKIRTKTSKKQGTARATAASKKAGKIKAAGKARSYGLIKQDSRMATGRGWRLSPDGGKTVLTATLLTTHDLGDRTIAVFRTRI
ncbi:hypothetical protein [Bradyrhizobium sp. CCBAU 51765]|uniref:hypothetical protein n=1 Tax=Bradyrhizobium sp. CCBAU 51765 TaxID=1325102 RepID=UPI001888888A|nr:hypothetical protein [Bradyrhizobium sp. CCBAU 51765]QOZ06658.1 hypothetical protein XH96_03345 [Bradyrhizobium sp. CCBAU 51765]